jgi:hypothetical protein
VNPPAGRAIGRRLSRLALASSLVVAARFPAAAQTAGQSECHWVDAADLDGDGNTDLMNTAADPGWLDIWLGDWARSLRCGRTLSPDQFSGSTSEPSDSLFLRPTIHAGLFADFGKAIPSSRS